MKHLYISTYALCALVAACASPALGMSIIDESFDTMGGFTQAMLPHVTDPAFMDAWFYMPGNGLDWGVGMGMAMVDVSMMAPMDVFTTLVYFSAKPAASHWPGDRLDLFLLYGADTPNILNVGVYGWPFGAEIPNGPNPGINGVELMQMSLPASTWPTPFADSFIGDLSGFEFIGATFMVGSSATPALPPDAVSGYSPVLLDNVLLIVTPEPASMVLAAASFGALTWMRKRKRKAEKT